MLRQREGEATISLEGKLRADPNIVLAINRTLLAQPALPQTPRPNSTITCKPKSRQLETDIHTPMQVSVHAEKLRAPAN
eukprot:14396190-Alexandrium_andersonii.AAC.1